MSESVQLLLLLGGLYLFECAQWTPLAAVGFRALLPGRWRRQRPWHPGPSWKRGAMLGAPWPPLTPPLACEPLPFAIGPAGLVLEGGRQVAWEDLGDPRLRERELLLEGEPIARLATRRAALLLGRLLREVSALRPGARPARLQRFVGQRWEVGSCRPRLRAFRSAATPLLVAANLLWVCLFVGLPLLLWTPLTVYWIEIAGAALLAWVGTIIGFQLLLRRASWLEREAWPDAMHRLLAMLSPVTSLRAADLVARELLADLEPLAVAAALLPAAHFGELARRALLELDDGEAQAAARGGAAAGDAAWLAAVQRRHLLEQLAARGLRAEELLAAPVPENERVRGWCPRCRSQYLKGEICPAGGCGGRALLPFAQSRPPG